MKTLLLTILISFRIVGHTESKDFEIIIEQSNMFGDSRLTLTQDSIKVISRTTLSGTKELTFKHSLTKKEKKELKLLISTIDLKKLEKTYHSDLVDDHYEFEFMFDVNGEIKMTTIYGVRHNEIFDLVKQVNSILPKEFEIQYNDNYLEAFETNRR